MTAEELEIAALNRLKKPLRCLKCGRRFRTDRCHRICPECKELSGLPASGVPALLSLDALLRKPGAEARIERAF